nr:HAMP domain-containing sensor histidine kinase [Sedimentibacter sp.]
MHSIRRKIGVLLTVSSAAAILLIMIFVNFTMNSIFEEYMLDVQNKRYETITTYLEEEYEKEGQWTENTGIELMHNAYMSNYNLTLYDKDNKAIWGMNPNDIRNKVNLGDMMVQEQGVYTTKKFELHYEDEVVGYVEIGQYSPLLMTEEDIQFKTSVNKSIVASGALTVIIITIMSMYFSKQFSAPIKEVANMSVKLSKGEFEAKTSSTSDVKEIEDLRNSVNILAEKLNKQDMLRKRLVSDISHEIRTPLNVLQNNLEAMIDGVFPVTSDRLSGLNDEIVRFGKLLNNLDILKEFESESMKLSFHALKLDQLLENLIAELDMEAESKNITLAFSKESEKSYIVSGDEDNLKQVFFNLIHNAIKFTGKNGEVSVNMYSRNKKIHVEIKDNGMGISSDDIPYIFERFYRGDKSRHEIEGNGIGLTIVKNILNLHSASIDVKSMEGEGTLFTIIFDDKE